MPANNAQNERQKQSKKTTAARDFFGRIGSAAYFMNAYGKKYVCKILDIAEKILYTYTQERE